MFNSYVPKEETFPIPLIYIDVTRTTHSNLDLIQAKRIDDFWNAEEKFLRFMDWFHKSCSVERGTSQRTKVVQEETDKCFKRLRDGITCGISMDQSQQSSAKMRKTGRTSAKARERAERAECDSLIRKTRNIKRPKMRGKKLEVQMAAAMPCKKKHPSHSCMQATAATLEQPTRFQRQKYACIVESHEYTGQRMEPTL